MRVTSASDHLGVIGGRNNATYLRIPKHWLPNLIGPSLPYALCAHWTTPWPWLYLQPHARACFPRDNAPSDHPLRWHAHVGRCSAGHPDFPRSGPINDSVRGRMSARSPCMRSVHSQQITGGGHEQCAGIWTDEAYVAHVFGVPWAVYGWSRRDTCVTVDYSAALVACVAPGAVVGGAPVHPFRRRRGG